MANDLVDEFVLQVHPIVLGTGFRLFADGTPHTGFNLVSSVVTDSGIVVMSYELAKK